MGQNFVLDYGGVVVNVDYIDSECGNLGDENSAESVCYGGVNADKRELRLKLFVLVPLNLEALAESLLIPCVLFVRVVFRVIGGDGVGDCFFVDTYDLAYESDQNLYRTQKCLETYIALI